MSLISPWGYTLTDLNILGSLLSVADFNSRTANKYSSDTRLETLLASASQIVRDYVGWHLYPSAACEVETAIIDSGVSCVRGDILIQLPARFVSAITSITIDGNPCSEYFLEHNGMLRIIGAAGGTQPYSKIKVKYTAGLSDSLMGAVEDVVANRTIKGLVSTNGVQSETAGGVSISYNVAYMADASGLGEVERAVISPYKLRGVF